MKLGKDLREFVALLHGSGARFLLVGGHAVAFHGHPRFTGDIDFLVERTPANAAILVGLLEQFGFGGMGFEVRDFLDPGMVIQLGRPPHRIDLLTSLDGVEFAEAWDTRVEAELDGVPVPVIGRAALIRNKRATGRPQDIADLSFLEE
jgi:hypothetical protein